MSILTKKALGAGLLLAISMITVNTSYAASNNNMASHSHISEHRASAAIKSNVDGQTELRCKSARCKARQERRIYRALCRLNGGTPKLWGCMIRDPEGGN